MNNFRKDFITKKSSCFKMEQRSPLGKVEGSEDEDPVNESKTNNPFKGSKKNKENKKKSNTTSTETKNEDGSVTVNTVVKRKSGEVKGEYKTDFKDGEATGDDIYVKTNRKGKKKVKYAHGKYEA